MLYRLATPSKEGALNTGGTQTIPTGKFVMAKHSSKKEHRINFKDTIAIHLHPDNIGIGFPLSPSHEHNMRGLSKNVVRKGQ
jgi:hypothetical protein